MVFSQVRKLERKRRFSAVRFLAKKKPSREDRPILAVDNLFVIGISHNNKCCLALETPAFSCVGLFFLFSRKYQKLL